MSDLSASITDFRKRLPSGVSPKVVKPKESPQRRPIEPSPKRPIDNVKSLSQSKKPRFEFEKYMEAEDLANQYNLSNSHLSTNLHMAVDIVKNHSNPITLDELKAELRTNDISKLLVALQSTDKIKFDEESGTLEYVSVHNIKNAQELIDYLSSQVTFKGISVRDLKDGWPNCSSTLNDLEKKNKILILRTKKDNTPRHVWTNYRELALGAIDADFVDMWQKVKLPSVNDLPSKLNERGIKPTSVDPSSLKKAGAVRVQKKQKKTRKGKITNVHMKGVLRDYS